MTVTQHEHLRLLKAHLESLLEGAKMRTPGRWKLSSFNSPLGVTGDFEGVIQIEATECRQSDPVLCEFWNPDDDEEGNFHFIASCAGNAEAGWKSTLAVIDWILKCEQFRESVRDASWPELEITTSILAAWPIETLKKTN